MSDAKTKNVDIEAVRDRAYEDGYARGVDQGTHDGYREGYDDALRHHLSLSDAIHEAGFDALEDFVGRYDAARRVWTFSQGGREVDVAREELR